MTNILTVVPSLEVYSSCRVITAGTSTEPVSLHLYKVFFEQNLLGYGAVLSLLLIGIIVATLLTSRRALTARSNA